MENKKTPIGFIIGRFQPLHPGHKEFIRQAAKASEQLIIFVGSSNKASDIKNPWSFEERRSTISHFLDHEDIKNVAVVPLNDYKYNDPQWITDIVSYIESLGFNPDDVTVFGHTKNDTGYLQWFPSYRYKEISTNINISATEVRQKLFDSRHPSMPSKVLDDYDYFQKEAERFSVYPYPETLNFNCSDIIVECNSHILLIQRKFAPGAGNWALPGGFKNRNETFMDCAIRELFEETNLRVPEKVIRGSVVSTQLFDSPTRAAAGIPRNTFCVHVKIKAEADGSLPRANGADDAAECKWVSLYDALNNYVLHDDHKDLLSTMTGVMPIPAHLNSRFN